MACNFKGAENSLFPFSSVVWKLSLLQSAGCLGKKAHVGKSVGLGILGLDYSTQTSGQSPEITKIGFSLLQGISQLCVKRQ